MRLIPTRNVQGVLLFDKPKGLSSNIALQRVKRLFQARKAGHTGSLDPIATGLLPICFGEATKFSRFLLDSDKHYKVTAKLGIKTTTGDSEGEVISQSLVACSTPQIKEKLDQLRGPLLQVPPMYSAVKYKGQPLYRLARQGLTIERQPREITVFDIRLLDRQLDSLTLDVWASKGTYMRVLVEDLGEMLGCGAHMTDLVRLESGPYSGNEMHTFEALDAVRAEQGVEALEQYLLPAHSAVVDMPDLMLSDAAATLLKQGKRLTLTEETPLGWVRLVVENEYFLGVGEVLVGGEVLSRRLTQEMIPL
jgi:tRNA pseudouridine55 synthase